MGKRKKIKKRRSKWFRNFVVVGLLIIFTLVLYLYGIEFIRYTSIQYDTLDDREIITERVKRNTTPDLNEVTRIGHIFLGWYVNSELTIPFEEDTVINRKTTLYAKWQWTGLYEIIDEEVTILSGSTYIGIALVIPRTIDGYPVVAIAEQAFAMNQSIETIWISNSVKTIGPAAFSNMLQLQSVMFEEGSSLEILPHAAFGMTPKLEQINLPNSLKEIHYMAFYNSESLNEIHLPEGLTVIGIHAFYNAKKLESVVIPYSVTLIEYGAFEGCSNLVEVIILRSGLFGITEIQYTVFNGTHSNLTIYVPADSLNAYKVAPYWDSYANRIIASPNN